MKEKILAQGSEALILKEDNKIIKKRIKKSYRLPYLDEKIRKRRTKSESKLLKKSTSLIPIPKITNTDLTKKEIQMEFIKGKKLSENLNILTNSIEICTKIGEQIAKLHNADIIHGDLTTSNMLLKNNSIYFIDFGLGFISNKIEDKAVDLHLIKQALEAKHFSHFKQFFKSILQGYKLSKNYQETIKRLEKVETRGRYKSKY